MNKVLENYSIDTLLSNAADVCSEYPSIRQIQTAIANDIDGCPAGPFSDDDIDDVLSQTLEILQEEVGAVGDYNSK